MNTNWQEQRERQIQAQYGQPVQATAAQVAGSVATTAVVGGGGWAVTPAFLGIALGVLIYVARFLFAVASSTPVLPIMVGVAVIGAAYLFVIRPLVARRHANKPTA